MKIVANSSDKSFQKTSLWIQQWFSLAGKKVLDKKQYFFFWTEKRVSSKQELKKYIWDNFKKWFPLDRK